MKKLKRLLADIKMTYRIVQNEDVVMIYLYDSNGDEYDKIYGNDIETLCEILRLRLLKNVNL